MQHFNGQMADVATGAITGVIVSIFQTKYQYFTNSGALVNAARGQKHSVSPSSWN